jgi:hypothetical protein
MLKKRIFSKKSAYTSQLLTTSLKKCDFNSNCDDTVFISSYSCYDISLVLYNKGRISVFLEFQAKKTT